ncbi:SEC14-like protein 4 [Amphiura filiformis]|uniref:SEC14-like protein 4 n=1 Tax=Amphiura filiformis TaxID=82378 RepID=UPI003B214C87
MSGRLGNLSLHQQQQLQQFKELLHDVLETHHEDAVLLQFLRARNFDTKKSSDMFRKNLEWQRRWKVDAVLQDYTPPKVLDMYYGGGIVGYDKDGDPVLLDPAGHRDWKGLLYSVKGSDLMRHSIWNMEKIKVVLEEQSKKLGRRVEQITMIADLEGMGPHFLWRPGLEYQKSASADFEQNYPETMKTCLLVNVPGIFHHIYPLAKFILKEEVRQKLKVLSGNWKEEILQYIDADQLPVHWGGTQTGPDGDPKCLHIIGEGHGTKVPSSYYMTTKELSSKHCITHDISRGSSLKLQYHVCNPGTILRYEFRTKHYDLGFSVWKQNDDGSIDEILEKQRYNCQMVPEDGHITLEQPGTYFVKFDNSYSRLRGKHLSYCIELINPGENLEDTNQENTHNS